MHFVGLMFFFLLFSLFRFCFDTVFLVYHNKTHYEDEITSQPLSHFRCDAVQLKILLNADTHTYTISFSLSFSIQIINANNQPTNKLMIAFLMSHFIFYVSFVFVRSIIIEVHLLMNRHIIILDVLHTG